MNAATAPEGAATRPDQGPGHSTAAVELTPAIRDAANRLALRANGHGHVQLDDLAALVEATGRLLDSMMADQAVTP